MRFHLRSSSTSTNSCRSLMLPWCLGLAWVVLLSLSGCTSKIEVEVAHGRKTSASATSLKPITAKPGDTVSLTGTGFTTKQKNLVRFTTASGDTVSAPVTVTSATAASFTMPEGVGLGLTSVVLESNGQQMTGPMSFVADLASNTLPILIDDASEICSTKQYIDKNGDTQTGTKNCSASGGSTAACTADGGSNCVVDGTTFKAAAVANLSAGNIKSGVTIAGQAGSVTPAPANCSADGATNCVAVTAYPAALASGAASKILSGQTLAGVSGNVTLPAVGKVLTGTAYGVGGTGSTGTLTIPTVSFVLDTAPAYGDPGSPQTPSLTSRGTWNLTTSFPGVGYYAGVSNAPSAATILTGTTITGVAGSATGAPANCSSAGQQSCVASGTYFAGTACTANSSACYLPTYAVTTQPLKAINYDTLNSSAASIRSGTTLGGVAGSLADCSTDGATGCVTTASYKSANMTNVTAGNIKSGVTIAGQLGDYPSASNPLSGATGTADLEQGNFDSQIKSATAFEYWTSAGSRQTGNGDADITASNIKDSVSIFGTSGTYTGSGGTVDAWDLRVGVTVGAVTGKLKVNCRNQANPILFDIDQGQAATITTGSPGTVNITAHGLANNTTVRVSYSSTPTGLSNATTYYVVNAAANTLQLSATSGGAAINITGAGANVTVHKWQATPQTVDIWDTIDDYNNNTAGMPGTVLSGWTNNDCGGVEITAGDDKVWKDVTTTAGGAASNCTTDGARCTMQDKITGLWWSKQQTNAAWWQAVSGCQSLNHNGQTGWRLPTQKELMEAYNHGVRSAASTNWITEAAMASNYFWSASSVSSNANDAWYVYLAYGSPSTTIRSAPAKLFVSVELAAAPASPCFEFFF